MFHGHLDYFRKPPLGGRPNTNLGDHGTSNVYYCWFILFYHVWGPAWIEIYWNSIWLRAQSHMTSHYTWGSVTTLHGFRGVLGWPLDTFIWAITISWSPLLARVWSNPKSTLGQVCKRRVALIKATMCLYCWHFYFFIQFWSLDWTRNALVHLKMTVNVHYHFQF